MSDFFKRSTQVITRQEGGSTLVFEQSTGAICILNPTSEFIWERCTGEHSVEDIARELGSSFDLSEFEDGSSLAALVEGHLRLMHKAKLVELEAAA
ncbi:MAG TPA: PqqD family peptide modification chaperone [Acidobacteriota bacterium]|nr:PqqD family peptide modification chaperone [Acidobacteriota bacterium]